jgi:hypothetical protein
MKKIILSALVVALAGGTAMADRHGGGGRPSGGHAGGRSGGVVVHENRGGGGWRGGGEARGNWRGGEVHHDGGWRGGVTVRGGGWNNSPRYYHTHGYARQNIWVNRPYIRTHYYDYNYRPTLFVEDYGAREGYIFVRGDWQWNGYEWVWQPGHYEPDQAYVEVY